MVSQIWQFIKDWAPLIAVGLVCFFISAAFFIIAISPWVPNEWSEEIAKGISAFKQNGIEISIDWGVLVVVVIACLTFIVNSRVKQSNKKLNTIVTQKFLYSKLNNLRMRLVDDVSYAQYSFESYNEILKNYPNVTEGNIVNHIEDLKMTVNVTNELWDNESILESINYPDFMRLISKVDRENFVILDSMMNTAKINLKSSNESLIIEINRLMRGGDTLSIILSYNEILQGRINLIDSYTNMLDIIVSESSLSSTELEKAYYQRRILMINSIKSMIETIKKYQHKFEKSEKINYHYSDNNINANVKKEEMSNKQSQQSKQAAREFFEAVDELNEAISKANRNALQRPKTEFSAPNPKIV